jgi:hypothetical protein
MLIEIHPKPDGMRHVNLMFCETAPDPEDLWVRERLLAFPVPPKRFLQWEREGREYQVWQYGECVIGDGLFFIERHKGVVDRIRAVCGEELDRAEMERGTLHGLISDTAIEFQEHARFTGDGRGELTVEVLEEAKLRDRMLRRLQAARHD